MIAFKEDLVCNAGKQVSSFRENDDRRKFVDHQLSVWSEMTNVWCWQIATRIAGNKRHIHTVSRVCGC